MNFIIVGILVVALFFLVGVRMKSINDFLERLKQDKRDKKED